MGRDVKDARVPADLLNVIDEVQEFDDELEELLERGKSERVQILSGTEAEGRQAEPYARTHVEISFSDENDLRECVRLLRWSDERLRARPDQLLRWDWQKTFRDGMTIRFGVNWYERDFFERRKDAFREPTHAVYYSQFGASADDFKIRHEVIGQS